MRTSMRAGAILLALCVVAGIGVVAIRAGVFPALNSVPSRGNSAQGPTVTSVPNAPPLTPPRTPPHGYKEYRSEFYRFEVFYPDNLIVKTHKEERSSITITFESADKAQGFQIFITPYGLPNISEARISADASGGVKERGATVIDGAEALVFFGNDALIGETREVWFVQKGFLYEVTTYKKLDAWLAHIMTSWIFLERGKPGTAPDWR